MQPKIIEKYFFFSLLAATFVFAFFIFRPFWIVLVLGASLSIVFYPVYSWFRNKHLPNWLASFLTLVCFVLILCIPIFGVGTLVFTQSQNLYHTLVDTKDSVPLLTIIGEKINQILPYGSSFNINEKVSSFVSFLTNNLANIFSATATLLISFVLLLLTIFYFLKDGEKWKETMMRLSPISDKDDQKIINRFVQTVNGVIKGYLFVAFIQGALMGIGLTLFNVPNPAIWGAIAGIAAIIPPLGTAVISLPAIAFLFLGGHTGAAIGLLVWSIVVVGAGDNILNPYIVGHKIDIPPFLMLFAVLGGISLLGPVGILIGPLIVSMLYALTDIYQTEFK